MSKDKVSLPGVPKGADRDTTVFLQALKRAIEKLSITEATDGSKSLKGYVLRVTKQASDRLEELIDKEAGVASILKKIKGSITESELSINLGKRIDKIEVTETALSNETQQRIVDMLETNQRISTEVTQRQDADGELTERVDIILAKTDENQASIVQEVQVRTGITDSHAQRLTALDTKTDNSAAHIGELQTATANNVESIANTKIELRADFNTAISNIEIGGRNFLLGSADVVFNSSDSGNGGLTVHAPQGYKSITPKNNGNAYGYLKTTTQMDAGTYTMSISVNTTHATSMYFRIGGVGDGVIQIPNTNGQWQKVTHTYTGTARAPDTTFLLGFVSLQAGRVIHFRGLKVEKGNKATDWTPAPEDVDGAIAKNSAAIDRESDARADAVQAVASDVSTLQASVGGNTASLQSQSQVIAGINTKLSATWSIKADVNGVVGGIALGNDGNTVDFIVRASTFAVQGPSGSKSVPFIVYPDGEWVGGVWVPGGVYIDTAFIRRGSFDSLSALSANIGTLTTSDSRGTFTYTGSRIELRDANGRLLMEMGLL